jgi:hypothetical protein
VAQDPDRWDLENSPAHLLRHNAIVSNDGKFAGVLSLPSDLERLKMELIPLLVHAGISEIPLRVGLTQGKLVYAVDLRKLDDEHEILPRLAQALALSGCRQLDYDVPAQEIYRLASDLVLTELADNAHSANGATPTD